MDPLKGSKENSYIQANQNPAQKEGRVSKGKEGEKSSSVAGKVGQFLSPLADSPKKMTEPETAKRQTTWLKADTIKKNTEEYISRGLKEISEKIDKIVDTALLGGLSTAPNDLKKALETFKKSPTLENMRHLESSFPEFDLSAFEDQFKDDKTLKAVQLREKVDNVKAELKKLEKGFGITYEQALALKATGTTMQTLREAKKAVDDAEAALKKHVRRS